MNPTGHGREVVFTLHGTAEMPDAEFERDAALVADDLALLRTFLNVLTHEVGGAADIDPLYALAPV